MDELLHHVTGLEVVNGYLKIQDCFIAVGFFLTQPMANLTKLLGIPYLVGKIKLKRLFHGPVAE